MLNVNHQSSSRCSVEFEPWWLFLSWAWFSLKALCEDIRVDPQRRYHLWVKHTPLSHLHDLAAYIPLLSFLCQRSFVRGYWNWSLVWCFELLWVQVKDVVASCWCCFLSIECWWFSGRRCNLMRRKHAEKDEMHEERSVHLSSCQKFNLFQHLTHVKWTNDIH